MTAAMTAKSGKPAQLVLPLLRLVPETDERPADKPPRPVPRRLDLDQRAEEGITAWISRVREALEAVLLVDHEGRLAAMSAGCGELLGLVPAKTVGALLLDLLTLVDFTEAAVPLPDPELQAPPLRVLRNGTMARGLVRIRRDLHLSSYDVVGIPLAGGVGALAFLVEI